MTHKNCLHYNNADSYLDITINLSKELLDLQKTVIENQAIRLFSSMSMLFLVRMTMIFQKNIYITCIYLYIFNYKKNTQEK